MTLRNSSEGLDEMIDEATKRYAADTEKPEEKARKVMANLLPSVQFYLEGGMWGFARSETLVNGVPPSPFLRHLL